MQAFSLSSILSKIGSVKFRSAKLIDNAIAASIYTGLDAFVSDNKTELLGECVLIAGFWRSGTTWLQQSVSSLIKAKTIFEPFDPKIPRYRLDVLPTFAPNAKISEAYHMPFSRSDIAQQHPQLHQYLVQSFTAQVHGAWVRTLRKNSYESFYKNKTIKFVRAQLCLHSIYEEFGFPILYLTRDPRAVIASIRRNNWGKFFDHPFLEKTLLKPVDGRTIFFADWTDEILRADRSDINTRIATFWALLEQYVRQNSTTPTDGICFLKYENLLAGDYSDLQRMLVRNGFRCDTSSNQMLFNVDSEMTQSNRKGISIQERQSGWVGELSNQEKKVIESIACRFKLDSFLCD